MSKTGSISIVCTVMIHSGAGTDRLIISSKSVLDVNPLSN